LENITFLIARRRNEQSRSGARWIEELTKATGLPSKAVTLLEPEQSVRKERRWTETVQAQLADGLLRRTSGLERAIALRAWDTCLVDNDETVECWLSHWVDYAFEAPARFLVGRLESLLAFDGDTVTVTSPDGSSGLSVDMYTESECVAFEVDCWGKWLDCSKVS
jgi:hypothetical protein